MPGAGEGIKGKDRLLEGKPPQSSWPLPPAWHMPAWAGWMAGADVLLPATGDPAEEFQEEWFWVYKRPGCGSRRATSQSLSGSLQVDSAAVVPERRLLAA